MGAADTRTHSSIFAHFFFAWILDPGSWTSTNEVFFDFFCETIRNITSTDFCRSTLFSVHCFTCVHTISDDIKYHFRIPPPYGFAICCTPHAPWSFVSLYHKCSAFLSNLQSPPLQRKESMLSSTEAYLELKSVEHQRFNFLHNAIFRLSCEFCIVIWYCWCKTHQFNLDKIARFSMMWWQQLTPFVCSSSATPWWGPGINTNNNSAYVSSDQLWSDVLLYDLMIWRLMELIWCDPMSSDLIYSAVFCLENIRYKWRSSHNASKSKVKILTTSTTETIALSFFGSKKYAKRTTKGLEKCLGPDFQLRSTVYGGRRPYRSTVVL